MIHVDKSCLPGSFLCAPSVWGVVQGGLNILFATFLAIQATRIRFVFDEDSFELKTVSLKGEENLEDSGENFVVGGANRWTYDSFVNWDFFPSEKFPILVYFKETQTPEVSVYICVCSERGRGNHYYRDHFFIHLY
jgi:NIMA (never in mitosis gene a)-related kinase